MHCCGYYKSMLPGELSIGGLVGLGSRRVYKCMEGSLGHRREGYALTILLLSKATLGKSLLEGSGYQNVLVDRS